MNNDERFYEALKLIVDMTGLDKGPSEEEYEEWHTRAWKFLKDHDLIDHRCIAVVNDE